MVGFRASGSFGDPAEGGFGRAEDRSRSQGVRGHGRGGNAGAASPGPRREQTHARGCRAFGLTGASESGPRTCWPCGLDPALNSPRLGFPVRKPDSVNFTRKKKQPLYLIRSEQFKPVLTSDGRDDEREMRRVKRTCMARAPRGRSPQGREVGPRVCRLGPRVYRTDTRSHLSLRAARSPRARRDTGPAVSLSAQGVEAVTTTRPATADTCSRRARPRRLLAARSGAGSVHPPPRSSALSPFPRGSSCKENEARRPGSRPAV